MSYDIPVTVGLEPIKGVASVIAAIAGLSKGMESAFKYADAIRSRRTFEIMGGNLEAMRKQSNYVVANTELMSLHSRLAAQGLAQYDLRLAAIASRFHMLGADTESLMRVISGGRPGGLREWLPAGALAALKAATTEQQRINILFRATDSQLLHTITNYDTLTDRLKRLQTTLKNIKEGPGWQFTKTLGLIAGGLLGVSTALKVLLGKTGLEKLFMVFKAFPVKGPLLFGGFAIKFFGQQLLYALPGLLKWTAGMALFSGLIKGLKLDEAVKLIPAFVAGFDMKSNKFMLNPSTIAKIDAVAPRLFRLLGKAMIFATNAAQSFFKVFEQVGESIGKVLGVFGLGSAGPGHQGVAAFGQMFGKSAAWAVPIAAMITFTGALGRAIGLMRSFVILAGGSFYFTLGLLGTGFAKLFKVMMFVGKNWKAALGIGLILTAIEMWRNLAKEMGGWGNVWNAVVELSKWGWESLVRTAAYGYNKLIDLMNEILPLYNNIAWMIGGEEATWNPKHWAPYGTETGAGPAANMTSQQVEAQYDNARATIDKLNAASADKKTKEGDTNVSVHIDGDQIDQVRHSQSRKETSKGLGVRTGVHP